MKLYDLTGRRVIGPHAVVWAGIANVSVLPRDSGERFESDPWALDPAYLESDPWALDPAYLPKTHDVEVTPIEIPSKIRIVTALDVTLPADAHILVLPQVAIIAWYLAKLGPSTCPIITAARTGRLYSPGSPGKIMRWATAHGEA